MKYPSGLSGTFKVTLDGVQDLAGNVADKVTINFSPAARNPLTVHQSFVR